MNEADPSILRFLIASREEVSSEQLRDDLLSMLVAGHETTGSALTWTLYLLTSNPDKMAKVCPAQYTVVSDTISTRHLCQVCFLTNASTSADSLPGMAVCPKSSPDTGAFSAMPSFIASVHASGDNSSKSQYLSCPALGLQSLYPGRDLGSQCRSLSGRLYQNLQHAYQQAGCIGLNAITDKVFMSMQA